ncbi:MULTISPECIES: L-lysine 6-transaminase [Sphingobacterium]|uniref:L-lysine-epsilon aminotransferase n=1 Tax=Sphingobacterium cellulitidis TaxID=1768011 RepID=A0A8H9G2I1_9SPHI|nr:MULTISPECIES: L-lysine 6-transaminase [Sphingobacterium]MBA8987260.1 L-lysine 6-transaminase [Sphingobacterium soli]OYD40651.1 L-lysine 6-transaminase [Sphingobacterium cellulitidis]OYD44135.1 L-lysine 6-transaminase [Sphingobacterium cellulitidis]WFB62988.1 L-lysine 6-transaminase [Sphingobacterium sp. WM]GGE31571.1 L-lysine 6-transaminase [Sphingobacterium soli]
MIRETHKRLAKHILADGLPVVMDLEKSHGSYIVDIDGKEYLDMFSMFASSPVGYNHPYILANEKQLEKVSINKLALSDIYPDEYADFMDVFERVGIPQELSYCFFIDGGGLAVENALKAAFDWKTRLNLSKGIEQEASQVIHFKQAFHGRTGYTLSLTNTKDPRKYMYFPKFNWPRISNPKLTFPLTEESVANTIELEKQAIQEIETAIANNPNDIACLILEPIQAEGGDNHFRKEFFVKLREICDKNDIILILDEVQTGIAMTGKMWCYQHYGIVPDVISFGKKTQVCGILANKTKFDRVEKNVFQESSRINSTFGGNLVDMIRFKLILEIIEKEGLVNKAETLGEYLQVKLLELSEKHPSISNVRGKGLLVAFDLPTPEARDKFVDAAMKENMLILGCGERSIRFRPHLTVSKEDLDKAISIVDKVVD